MEEGEKVGAERWEIAQVFCRDKKELSKVLVV